MASVDEFSLFLKQDSAGSNNTYYYIMKDKIILKMERNKSVRLTKTSLPRTRASLIILLLLLSY